MRASSGATGAVRTSPRASTATAVGTVPSCRVATILPVAVSTTSSRSAVAAESAAPSA